MAYTPNVTASRRGPPLSDHTEDDVFEPCQSEFWEPFRDGLSDEGGFFPRL